MDYQAVWDKLHLLEQYGTLSIDGAIQILDLHKVNYYVERFNRGVVITWLDVAGDRVYDVYQHGEPDPELNTYVAQSFYRRFLKDLNRNMTLEPEDQWLLGQMQQHPEIFVPIKEGL